MNNKLVTVRPATIDDIRQFAKDMKTPTIKAWVGEEDGKVIAIGGLAFAGGRWIGFLDLTDDARKYKYRIARMAIRIMDEAKRMGIRYIWAGLDDNEPGAEKWQRSLGFEKHGKLMRWKGD